MNTERKKICSPVFFRFNSQIGCCWRKLFFHTALGTGRQTNMCISLSLSYWQAQKATKNDKKKWQHGVWMTWDEGASLSGRSLNSIFAVCMHRCTTNRDRHISVELINKNVWARHSISLSSPLYQLLVAFFIPQNGKILSHNYYDLKAIKVKS